MDAERWKRVDDLLQSVLQVPGDQQDAFLQEACGDDAPLLEEVRSLLASHQNAGGFLEHSLIDAAKLTISPLDDEPAARSATGRVVSHYRILSQLGHGGMGSVWLAERNDGRFDRRVAIKFLNIAVNSPLSLERFKREGAILARLSHPHIAELIDAGVTPEGEPFLVLEHVQGKHIDEYCDEHRLDVDRRIGLVLDVLAAVGHSHSNLIVHRDIKPANVLVRDDGQVKLLDFGIAKLLFDNSDQAAPTLLTLEGDQALTPRYAAPEQITAGSITTATDVYALGVLLYLLLSGRYSAGPGPHTPTELVRSIVESDTPKMSHALTAAGAETAATAAMKRLYHSRWSAPPTSWGPRHDCRQGVEEESRRAVYFRRRLRRRSTPLPESRTHKCTAGHDCLPRRKIRTPESYRSNRGGHNLITGNRQPCGRALCC